MLKTKDLKKIYLTSGKFTHYIIKIVLLFSFTINDFIRNKLSIRAAALSFISILSIIPGITLILGFSQFFGTKEFTEKILYKNFQTQKEVLNYIINVSQKLLDSVRSGFLTVISVIFIVWSVFKLVIWFKKSIDSIWNDYRNLKIIIHIKQYIIVFILLPLFLSFSAIIGISVKILIATLLKDNSTVYEYVSPFIVFLLKFSPYIIIWFSLILIYKITPYSKVKMRYAIISGIFIGILYQITQYLFVHFQIGVSNYNSVYGVFAFIPLFLVWIQLSWILILFGAQMTFVLETFDERFDSN